NIGFSCPASCHPATQGVKSAQRRNPLQRASHSKYKTFVDQIPPPTRAMTQPNWWKRNWKWFVPLGCFSIALLFAVFGGSILVIVFSAMKSTDLYKDALTK